MTLTLQGVAINTMAISIQVIATEIIISQPLHLFAHLFLGQMEEVKSL